MNLQQTIEMVVAPRRSGRSKLSAAIAETLSKKFVGVDPATDPGSVVMVDSLGAFKTVSVSDTHGYITNKVPPVTNIKHPKLLQVLMQRFNKKGQK